MVYYGGLTLKNGDLMDVVTSHVVNPMVNYKVGPLFENAKLVHITPMSLWFMVPITIVFMGFINHLITGGPHLVWVIVHGWYIVVV